MSAAGISSAILGLSTEQVLSITIFTTTITATILFWKYKLPISSLGVAFSLSIGLIDVPYLVEAMNIDVILFLLGIMVMVRFLEERHFFEYLISLIINKVGANGKLLIVVMMFLSGVFAALVGIVASSLFMITSLLYVTSRLNINPIPYVMMIVFASNIGSAATPIGNPGGLVIALKGSLTIDDFLRWATPIAVINLLLVTFISLKIFSKDISRLDTALKILVKREEERFRVEMSERDIYICGALFLGTLVGLMLHHSIEEALGLTRNSMLVGITLISAGISLLIEGERVQELIERGVDWVTIVFFMMLFALVGILEYTEVTGLIAHAFSEIPGGEIGVILTITVLVGILSAFLDNVLAIAAMAPVIRELSTFGLNEYPLWWGAHFAGTFFGNLTLIASIANLIAIGIIERRRLGSISFSEWLRIGSIITLISTIVALFLLIFQMKILTMI